MKRTILTICLLFVSINGFCANQIYFREDYLGSTSSSGRTPYRYMVSDEVWIDGFKAEGTATNNSTTKLLETTTASIVSVAENNSVYTGTGNRTTYKFANNIWRTALYDASGTFMSGNTVHSDMMLVRTDTNVIVHETMSGIFTDNYQWLPNTDFPTGATAYAIHGFAPQAPTNYLGAFQWNLIVITGGTGEGQVRKIKNQFTDGSTVWLHMQNVFTVAPDSTSTFKIAWSPLDIYWAELQTVTDAGLGQVAVAPTAGGSGYAVGNILTVTEGTGATGTVTVDAVSSGVVTRVSIQSTGAGHTTGTGKTTTGGSGSSCTVNITQVGRTISTVNWDAQTGQIPLTFEWIGAMRIGSNGTQTWWGYNDLLMINSATDSKELGYTIATADSDTFSVYGEGDWGTSANDTPKFINNKVGQRGHARNRYAGANISLAGSPDDNWWSGKGLSTPTRSMFATLSGGELSYHNNITGSPKTTRSVGDYGSYDSGGWWGYKSPFQPQRAEPDVYEDFTANNTGSSTLAGSRGLGWCYADNFGQSNPDWFDGRNTNADISNQILDADGSQCDWWDYTYTAYGTQTFNLWLERKSIQYTIVDANSGSPIEGVTVTIKNARGETVSYEDTGVDLTTDISYNQTTIYVDDRSLLNLGEDVFVDSETITLSGSFTQSGAGATTGNTRESDLPLHFPATHHKYNTAGFDKNIYRRTSVNTDSDGKTPKFYLLAFTSHIPDDTTTGSSSQVTKGGVNYTVTTSHYSEDGTNEPPGANWSISGTQGFPWRDNAWYWVSGVAGKVSWTEHGPFSVVIQKPGYEKFVDTFNPGIDGIKTEKTVKLKYRRFIETKSREGI